MKRYQWASPGDVNAFFGLMLDNVADLVLAVSLLAGAFGLPASFALRYMVPGTALGVVFGDLAFTYMAFRLARQSGRTDVTAMPLGLDTPSTFGMVFFVLGPAFLEAKAKGADPEAAATFAWHIGISALVVSGFFKLACALFSSWARSVVPRAGLLGSLAAIALVLISFLPLLEIFQHPLVGFVCLAIVLTTLVARVELPLKIPGALGALLVGTAMYYLMQVTGYAPHKSTELDIVWLPTEWTSAWQFSWLSNFSHSLKYLPVVIPFALATVVGGIDCTESAAAAGDEYHTGRIIAVEAVATLIAGLCGGVIQTTPYIGHPAYKAMGGRAAYTLATALFIGTAGALGYFSALYAVIPQAAVYPILIFVGLEITSQSFQATPKRHYPAVAMACVPAMAYLVMLFADNLLGESGKSLDDLTPALAGSLQTLRTLANGFIVTSLLWASAVAAIIDRRLARAAAFFAVAAMCCAVGVIHSPLPGSPLLLAWSLPELPHAANGQTPLVLCVGYLMMAVLLWTWSLINSAQELSIHEVKTKEH